MLSINRFMFTLSVVALSTAAGLAQASEIEDAVIDKVIEGYGGTKFENMKSLTLKSELRYDWVGQGQSPDYLDLAPMRKIHEIDFENDWGSEESWALGGDIMERVLTTDDGQYTINYLTDTYGFNSEADYYAHFGAEIRASDTLLARELIQNRESAEHRGQKTFQGAVHDLLYFDMPGTGFGPVLWVNQETGHISKMERRIPDFYDIFYVFGNFKTSDGVTYADDFTLYVNDTMIEYAKWRTLDVNRVRRNIFKLDRGLTPEPDRLDSSEMTVKNIGGNIYHVGQNGAFSTFYETDTSIVAVGAYGGLTERFEAYQSETGTEKSLGQVVVTHFHEDHLGGAADALELGAVLYAPETARANLNATTEQELSDTQFIVITDETALPGLEIKLIDTIHSPDYALTYIPAAKTVFQADHYNSFFAEGGSPVWRHAVELRDAIEATGWDVEFVTSAHSPKPESWEDFTQAVATYKPGPCGVRRDICRDDWG